MTDEILLSKLQLQSLRAEPLSISELERYADEMTLANERLIRKNRGLFTALEAERARSSALRATAARWELAFAEAQA